jgi:hypothetical protein
MSSPGRLFEVVDIAPVPLATRMAGFKEGYDKTGHENAQEELRRRPEYLVGKLARLTADETLVISGVEVHVDEGNLPPAA